MLRQFAHLHKDYSYREKPLAVDTNIHMPENCVSFSRKFKSTFAEIRFKRLKYLTEYTGW